MCHVCLETFDKLAKNPPGEGISMAVKLFIDCCCSGDRTTELFLWMLVLIGGGLCCISVVGDRIGSSITCSGMSYMSSKAKAWRVAIAAGCS